MSLPRLDFSALTHNAAKWPLPAKAVLGCALAGLVLWVGDGMYLSPSRERLQGIEAQGVVLQRQVAEKAGLAASLEARSLQFQAMQARFSGLLQQLPGASGVPALLEDIARLGAANAVLVDEIVLLDEQPRPLYIEQPLHLRVTGAYHDLAMFVSALGGLPRIVTVHDVALRVDGAALRLELLAKTYRNPSPGAQPDQAFEPGPRFVYDALALRNPFRPRALQVDHVPGRPALAPDPDRARGALEGIAVDQFEMVGTLSRGMQTFALLRAATTVHRLAVGDYLGPDHGRVTAIAEGYVELVELFPDEQGAWLERPRTLVLNVNS